MNNWGPPRQWETFDEQVRKFAERMDMPPHLAPSREWGPEATGPLIQAIPFTQCPIRYGSHQCEREDQHPLPHRTYIKTEWQ